MTPELSVIIVNYNVAYFLEQCLNSCIKAAEFAQIEIIVIDNNSVDGSKEMMEEKFPDTLYVFNTQNVGFSKANNQGMKMAKAPYVLLLNPDTVVEEQTFRKVIDFMNENPEAGGLGVRMLDGSGKFLPESKRGLPTPAVAFYKIFGLSALFPKSKTFGQYHLGYLDEFKTHEVEVLSGAFMMMRKSVLDEIGLLDEDFFMYGEDIDLSYRIVKAGFKNIYFPETRIIHYKGESTKKGSVNYVFVFYKAMIIFAEKHFSQNNAKLFSFLIQSAVYFRAGLALVKRLFVSSYLFLADAAFIGFVLFALVLGFEWYGKIIPKEVWQLAIPIYTTLWLVTVYVSGGYDKPVRWINVLRGFFLGTTVILALYALMPKSFQFSRLFIVLGAGLGLFYWVLSRNLLQLVFPKLSLLKRNKNRLVLIVGKREETMRVKEIMNNLDGISSHFMTVSSSEEKHKEDIGTILQLEEIASVHKAEEVIFCAKDISAEDTISWMSRISNIGISFKIAQPESSFIIGSNSIDHPGELYLTQIASLNEAHNKRIKRTFDFFASLMLILVMPITWLFFSKKSINPNLIFKVLTGKMTFVGYSSVDKQNPNLPKLRPSIFSTSDQLTVSKNLSDYEKHKLNLIYAKDYSWRLDMKILFGIFS